MAQDRQYQALTLERDGAIATITLNRPESYNALNAALKAELLDALKIVARDSGVRCVVLTGAGKAFCSGQDLKEGVPESATVGDTLRTTYNPIVRLLRGMEKPMLAAVNGVAAGAGCSLALACDLRIASDAASFTLAFTNIGLVPDSGACFFLPRLVGMGVALDLALTGRVVRADEALRLGLANRVVPAQDFPSAVAELAATLAARPTRALGLSKRAINQALTMDLEQALEYEAWMQEIAAATDDFREGVTAFREKRTPRYEGR
ncbi:MAG TPA: enoyl-CoA hydratase-related protein [Chloroflexota bacterium]|nr:enoyl-CoA hydratase-related protein [Chloroflexota bacterium]